MLITFKSKAAAEILMYKEHAKRILDLLGKDPDQGVITAPEMPHAIAVLEREIGESRAHFAAEELQRPEQQVGLPLAGGQCGEELQHRR